MADKLILPSGSFWLVNPITHKSFRPYATAIGQAALAWNELQETLGNLFNIVVSKEADGLGIALTLWHAIDSDRAQRKMLKDALERITHFRRITPAQAGAIGWLLSEANKLSDARNDIIHSPLQSITDSENAKLVEIKPRSFTGHPRARKLARRHLLSEFRWCRDTAITLSIYCRRTQVALVDDTFPLPNIPRLPSRGQKNQKPARRP